MPPQNPLAVGIVYPQKKYILLLVWFTESVGELAVKNFQSPPDCSMPSYQFAADHFTLINYSKHNLDPGS